MAQAEQTEVAPDTLPADFFSKEQGSGSTPDTLPAGFFSGEQDRSKTGLSGKKPGAMDDFRAMARFEQNIEKGSADTMTSMFNPMTYIRGGVKLLDTEAQLVSHPTGITNPKEVDKLVEKLKRWKDLTPEAQDEIAQTAGGFGTAAVLSKISDVADIPKEAKAAVAKATKTPKTPLQSAAHEIQAQTLTDALRFLHIPFSSVVARTALKLFHSGMGAEESAQKAALLHDYKVPGPPKPNFNPESELFMKAKAPPLPPYKPKPTPEPELFMKGKADKPPTPRPATKDDPEPWHRVKASAPPKPTPKSEPEAEPLHKYKADAPPKPNAPKAESSGPRPAPPIRRWYTPEEESTNEETATKKGGVDKIGEEVKQSKTTDAGEAGNSPDKYYEEDPNKIAMMEAKAGRLAGYLKANGKTYEWFENLPDAAQKELWDKHAYEGQKDYRGKDLKNRNSSPRGASNNSYKALKKHMDIKDPQAGITHDKAREQFIGKPLPKHDLHEVIGSKDTAYHATDLEGVDGILRDGKIIPMTDRGTGKGVSVSRVPQITSVFKGGTTNKVVTFAIDNSKIPPARPIVENALSEGGNSYGKTKGTDYKIIPERIKQRIREIREKQNKLWTASDGAIYDLSIPYDDRIRLNDKLEKEHAELVKQYAKPMNKSFEFENRTYDKPVPLKAVRAAYINKEALRREIVDKSEGRYSGEVSDREIDQEVKRLTKQLNDKGIYVKVYENGKEMFSDRAKASKPPLKNTPIQRFPAY